jgi:hypothetical protein
MVQAILAWSGAVVAIVVLALMALGPVIVEVDSWWYERRHNRRRAKRSADGRVAPAAGSADGHVAPAGGPVAGHVARSAA